MADLPIKELGDEAPLYDRPHVASPALPVMHAREVTPPIGISAALEKLIAHAGAVLEALGVGAVRPRHPRQYRAAARRRCRRGARAGRAERAGADRRRDAALLRGRSVRGRQAGGGGSLAQHHRGRRPAARHHRQSQFRQSGAARDHGPVRRLPEGHCRKPAARSISRSCPATSRSTTRPTAAASCRRRRSAASALLDDFTKSATLAFKAAGEAILLIGETQGWLGQSVYLRDICGREEGAPPPVDLAAEKRNGDVVRGMIHAGTATAVHDVSDGGLLIALAEMAIASGIGAQLLAAPSSIVPHAWWFGEDQARYIVTVPAAEAGLVLAKMKGAGVPCARIGTTGGDAIAVAGEASGVDRETQHRFRELAAGLHERQGVVLRHCESERRSNPFRTKKVWIASLRSQ